MQPKAPPMHTRWQTAQVGYTPYRQWAIRLRQQGNSTDSNGVDKIGCRISAHRSSACRKTGCVSYNPRPIPAYCAPWPVKRNAIFGRRVDVFVPVTIPAASPVARYSASRACATSRAGATIARRCAKCARPVFAVYAMFVSAVSFSLLETLLRVRTSQRFERFQAALAESASTCG